MTEKSLIIWLTNGNTCKFEQVQVLQENDHIIKFEYFGVSTQVKRTAVFHRDNIAGYALEC